MWGAWEHEEQSGDVFVNCMSMIVQLLTLASVLFTVLYNSSNCPVYYITVLYSSSDWPVYYITVLYNSSDWPVYQVTYAVFT